jgi:NRPS condensation-like uncharacterized protein
LLRNSEANKKRDIKKVNFEIATDEFKKLAAYCEEEDFTVSQAIRRFIRTGLRAEINEKAA